jgi:hypothetical protein
LYALHSKLNHSWFVRNCCCLILQCSECRDSIPV